MKKRHIVYINLVFLGLMMFSAGMVYQFMTGKKPLNMIADFTHRSKPLTVETATCVKDKAPIDLKTVQHPSLQKLSLYQQACHSFATDTMMTFVSMPSTDDQAIAYAEADAALLKDFASHKVRPLVVAEPTDKQGAALDFSDFASGYYNPILERYFTELQKQGVTDEQMGIWTPFPEANLPYWENNKPEYFAPAVNNYVAVLRKVFPTAQTSILLNSATYDTTDFNWENGDYQSLDQYVKGIAPGTINYAGLQGFPWMARQGGTGAILNAAEFLNPDLLTEMASTIGTKKVWFNTGTFSTKYTLDPARIVEMSPERRKSVLRTIEDQAVAVQSQGYDVSINIFAQDKSKTAEETDWSYWTGNKPFSSESTPIITDFINDLSQKKINFWLFDR